MVSYISPVELRLRYEDPTLRVRTGFNTEMNMVKTESKKENSAVCLGDVSRSKLPLFLPKETSYVNYSIT